MRILILGASGMIGCAMFRVLSQSTEWSVQGAIRSSFAKTYFPTSLWGKLCPMVELGLSDELAQLFSDNTPDVVINCIGVTKHVPEVGDPVAVIGINSLLPHRLANLCRLSGARLIHVSTDCVFSGNSGNYFESSLPDAVDLYGRSKILGEVTDDGALTLRTSTIGHENGTRHGLLEWFLSQQKCRGYTGAHFSGLPSIIFAAIVRDYVIPNPSLSGLYHVGGPPINKYALLRLIAKIYRKNTTIIPDASFSIDRTLNSTRFSNATGFLAPSWSELVKAMYADNIQQKVSQ
jgi:dTDP-4-dehydrorhamnose reductase